ncbi:MAG: hypothetical protein RH860_16850 [Cytophagales bacterium]
MFKRLLSLVFLAMFSTIIFSSCNPNEAGPCNCPDNAPWSVPGSENCYDDPFDCEASEGKPCEICS